LNTELFLRAHPDIFRRVAERKPVRMCVLILKSFGRLLLALKNPDLLKVDVAGWNTLNIKGWQAKEAHAA
jgi:hypothetical protein